MRSKFIEAVGLQPGSGAPGNHGKFMVACFDQFEWDRPSMVDAELGRMHSLLARVGWGQDHYLVTDLQTGEGAIFRLGGHPVADLEKHAIWVCPLFEPFLEWLYEQYRAWARSGGRSRYDFLASLTTQVDIELPLIFAGYRRTGPKLLEERDAAIDRLHRVIVANYDLMPETVLEVWRETQKEMVR